MLWSKSLYLKIRQNSIDASRDLFISGSYLVITSYYNWLYLFRPIELFSPGAVTGRQTNQAFSPWCLPLAALDGRQIKLFRSGVCRWMLWTADKSGFFALVSAVGRIGRQTNPAFLLWCLPLDDLGGRQIRLFCSGVCHWLIWTADKSGFFVLLSAAGCCGRQTNQAFLFWCLPLDALDGRQIRLFRPGVCRWTIWAADKSGFFALLSAAGCCGRQAKRPAYRPCKLWTIRRSF